MMVIATFCLFMLAMVIGYVVEILFTLDSSQTSAEGSFMQLLLYPSGQGRCKPNSCSGYDKFLRSLRIKTDRYQNLVTNKNRKFPETVTTAVVFVFLLG